MTIVISNSPNVKLVCALLQSNDVPDDVPGAKLHCTSMPSGCGEWDQQECCNPE